MSLIFSSNPRYYKPIFLAKLKFPLKSHFKQLHSNKIQKSPPATRKKLKFNLNFLIFSIIFLLWQSRSTARQFQGRSSPDNHTICAALLNLLLAKCDFMFHRRISDRQSFWDSIGHNNLHVYSNDWTANIRDGWNNQRLLGNDARQIHLWHWRGIFSGRSISF